MERQRPAALRAQISDLARRIDGLADMQHPVVDRLEKRPQAVRHGVLPAWIAARFVCRRTGWRAQLRAGGLRVPCFPTRPAPSTFIGGSDAVLCLLRRRLALHGRVGAGAVGPRAPRAVAEAEGCGTASAGLPHARPEAGGARDDILERAADSLHRSQRRRRRGVRARPRACAFEARPDRDGAHAGAGAVVGDDRPRGRRDRPRPARPLLWRRRGGDRAKHGRGHPALGRPLRGRPQPLPGQRRPAAARLRRPRSRARALDNRRPDRHRASRRHRRELAGVGQSAPVARAGGLARSLGASGEGGEGVAARLRRPPANGRDATRAGRALQVRQQQRRRGGPSQRHRRRADGQRSPSRHSRSERLADRRSQVALLSRGGADAAGAASLRHRPQSAHRLGRHQPACRLQRPLRCRRGTGIRDCGEARAYRRALVVRHRSDRARDALGADRDRRAAARAIRPAAACAEMDRARRERRDRRHAGGEPGAQTSTNSAPRSTASPCRDRTCSMPTPRGISAR